MGVTNIQWTDFTFNPWWGCARVSPACRFCYADTLAHRWGFEVWRRHGPRRMMSDGAWARPAKWNRDAKKAGVPAKVFCASMADVFEDHPQVTEARKRLWDVIDATPWLRWQLLTKRPENIADMAPWGDSWPPHVWIGTSVENQKFADERIPLLLQVPAAVRFLSCEPLLGRVNLFGSSADPGPASHAEGYSIPTDYGTGVEYGLDVQPGIDWLICGGESGAQARPTHPAWFRSLRDQCRATGTAFFMKQIGEWRVLRNGEYPPPGPTRTMHERGDQHDPILVRHGGHNGQLADLPPDLRIREFPAAADLAGAA